MRCKLLVMVFFVNILLVSSMGVEQPTQLANRDKRGWLVVTKRAQKSGISQQKCKSGDKPAGMVLKPKPKPNNTAMKAAHDASSASSSQPCAADVASKCAKKQLALKAAQAAAAAQAALEGKRQVIVCLHKSICEAEALSMEIQNSMKKGKCGADVIERLGCAIKRNLKRLNNILKEAEANLELFRRLVCSAHRDLKEKQDQLISAKHRFSQLKSSFQDAKKDCEVTKGSVQKAACAAQDAKERIDTISRLVKRLKDCTPAPENFVIVQK